MITLHITEAATVQMPLVRHTAETGWIPVPPQEAQARRGGTPLLYSRQREKDE